jgi:putative ABC transport system permease protein
MVEDFREMVRQDGAGRTWARVAPDALRSLASTWRQELAGFVALPWHVRYGLRSLRRDPGFALMAFAVLALGLAASAAILGILNAYLVRPLPYPEADRLITVRPSVPLPLEAVRDVFEVPLTWDLDVFTLTEGDQPRLVYGAWVVPGFFQAFGVEPALGRAFTEEDAREDRGHVAVISHSLWQERFGGDAAVLGRTMRAFPSDRPDDPSLFTIVGVLPRTFWFHNQFVELLAPLGAENNLYMGRLRAGVPLDEAAEVLNRRLRELRPQAAGGAPVTVHRLVDEYVRPLRPTLLTLGVTAALVLAIAVGNVALLVVVRTHNRAHEMAVREVLGAERGRVLGQLLVEGFIVAGAAGLAGAGLAALALGSGARAIESRLGTWVPGGPERLAVDLPVLAAVAALCAGVAVVLGLVPLAALSRWDLRRGLSATRGGFGGRLHRRLMGGVVAGEVAFSLSLAVAAGLVVGSAGRLSTVEMGFTAEGVVTSELNLPRARYPDPAERVDFHLRLAEAAASLPGVVGAGIGDRAPILWDHGATALEAEVGPGSSSGPVQAVGQTVDAGYFQALEIPVLRGRGFGDAGTPDAEPAVIVSEGLARDLWPGLDPVGRRLREVPPRGAEEPPAHMGSGGWRTVVGVVGEVREELTGTPRGEYYVPVSQMAPWHVTVLLRTGPGAPDATASLRVAVANLDPEVALTNVGWSLEDTSRDTITELRFLAMLLSAAGVFAVSLAMLGLYGTVSYGEVQRRREVAIRMAVGARAGQVSRLFLAERVPLLASGMALGLAAAVALAPTVATRLDGVSPWQPGPWLVATALLAAVALLAVWIPARRAGRTDPMRVMREE